MDGITRYWHVMYAGSTPQQKYKRASENERRAMRGLPAKPADPALIQTDA